jgi:SAM-dependent methyltransferase
VPEDRFGERVAKTYDDDAADMFAPEVVEPAVAFLAERAAGGAALEFGIGTGRIALPLSRRGVAVHGIDLSEAMIAQLQAKPGAESIGVTVGDCAHARVPRRFTLVYLVFNTIMNLTTQEEQVACFVNAAEHLEPGGCFVVEVGVPDLRRLPPGETIRPFAVGSEHLGFDEYDVATQGLVSHHYRVTDGGLAHHAVPFRYVWPAELDLMARIAGMTLAERWHDWTRLPYTADSTAHVSVWRTPA